MTCRYSQLYAVSMVEEREWNLRIREFAVAVSLRDQLGEKRQISSVFKRAAFRPLIEASSGESVVLATAEGSWWTVAHVSASRSVQRVPSTDNPGDAQVRGKEPYFSPRVRGSLAALQQVALLRQILFVNSVYNQTECIVVVPISPPSLPFRIHHLASVARHIVNRVAQEHANSRQMAQGDG